MPSLPPRIMSRNDTSTSLGTPAPSASAGFAFALEVLEANVDRMSEADKSLGVGSPQCLIWFTISSRLMTIVAGQ